MVNVDKVKSEIVELKKQIKNNPKKNTIFERIEEYTQKYKEIDESRRYFEYSRARDRGDHVLADQIIGDLSSGCQKLFKRRYYYDNLHKTHEIEFPD